MKGKKRKRAKYHTDERGHFVWENFFVHGKQKRSKRRVMVIDGQIIDDPDTWLIANAGDDVLHAAERWDLIERRALDEKETQTNKTPMKRPPRILRLDIHQLEAVFDSLAIGPADYDIPYYSFLNLTTGTIHTPEDDDEAECLLGDENHLCLPNHLFEDLHWGSLDEFVDSLPKDAVRARLMQAIRGKGAFRRLKDIVFGSGNAALKHQWLWFERRRKRECIMQWLHDEDIEPDWGCDIFEPPPLPNKRGDLLRAVLDFVRNARKLPGVQRIAVVGSLTTDKAIPKDVDLLVGVEDGILLEPLARLSRRLSGATMATGDGCGADVFLHNPQGEYLGRICQWKVCAPGIRMGCLAQNCGRREYLSDDLQIIRINQEIIASPALELWPAVIARTEMPHDVQNELITQLG